MFTIAKKGDAPTIESKFSIFFGELEVKMTTAPGTGIVSTIVLESDDLDEIDWVRGIGPIMSEGKRNEIKDFIAMDKSSNFCAGRAWR